MVHLGNNDLPGQDNLAENLLTVVCEVEDLQNSNNKQL